MSLLKKFYITIPILVFGIIFNVSPSFAFTPPTTSPGSGGGLLYVDSNGNIGVKAQDIIGGNDAATPPSGAFSNIFMLTATSTPPGFALRNVATDLAGDTSGFSLAPATYVWQLTPWGGSTFFNATTGFSGDRNRIVIYPNGKVSIGGIKSGGPSNMLEVLGNVGATSFVGAVSGSISSANVSSGVFGSLQGNGNFAFPAALGVGMTSTSIPAKLYVSQNSTSEGLIVNQAGTGPIIDLRDNGTSVFRVNDGGKVGIGTTSPGATLDIRGAQTDMSLVAASNPAAGTFTTQRYSLTKTKAAVVFGTYYGDASGAALNVFTYDKDGALFINGNGNVGIGTTSPTDLVDIYKSAGATLTVRSDAGSARINLDENNIDYGGYIRYDASGNYLAIGTHTSSDSDLIYVPRGGAYGNNVGIGTSTPAYKLDVVGGARFSQPVVVGSPVNSNEATTKSYVDSIVGGGSGTGSFATLSVTGTSTLATTSGNVGIGTASPGYKLHINADVNDGIAIEANNALLGYDSSSGKYTQLIYWNGGSVYYGRSDGVSNTGTIDNYYFRTVGATRMTIDSSGNVGIGTTSPANKLDVFESGTNIKGASVRAGSGANQGINFIPTLGSGGYNPISSAGDMGIIFSNGTSGNGNLVIAPWSSSASGIKILGNGNVGIGTTSPGYKLDVSGTAQFTQPVIVGTPTSGSHAATKSYVDSSVSTNTYWTSTSTGIFYNSGNVGIGTASPGAQLNVYQVAGSSSKGILISGDEYYVTGNGDANGILLIAGVNRVGNRQLWIGDSTILGSPTLGMFRYQTGTDLPTIDAVTGDGATRLNVDIGSATKNVGIGFGDSYTGLPGSKLSVVGGVSVGVNYRSTVAPSNGIIVEGAVGIGTTSPTAKLEVKDSDATVYSPTTLTYANTGSDILNIGNDNSSASFASIRFTTKTSGSSIGRIALLDSGGAGNFAFLLRGPAQYTTEKMRITSSGNVGINDTTPSYKLDVNGTAQFTQPVIVGTPTASNHAATKSYVDSAAGGGVGAGTSGQTLRHNGTAWIANSLLYNNGTNIGIGTTSPTATLTISKTAGNYMFDLTNASELNFKLRTYNTGTATINSDSFNIGLYYSTSENTGIHFYRGGGSTGGWLTFTTNNGTERMRIDNQGNVGIGTTSPGKKLDVNGTIGLNGNSIWFDSLWNQYSSGNNLYLTQTGTGGAEFRVTGDGVDYSNAYALVGSNIKLNSNGVSYFNGGNVGIGTTSPGYKLDVSGTGRFTQPVIVGTPTATNHAATKSYVDSSVSTNTYWTSTSTGIFYNSGSVGIGTTSPTGKLELGAGEDVSIKSLGKLTFDVDYTGGPDTGDGIDFKIAGNTAMSIQGANPYTGNIGIGTTSPDNLLTLVGAAGTFPGLQIYEGGSVASSNHVVFLGDGASSGKDGVLQLYSAGTLKNLFSANGNNYITGGNVGIGTTLPGAKLDVKGVDTDNALLARFYSNTSVRGSFGIRNGVATNPTTFIGTLGANENLAIGTVNTEKMRITSSGNVGIGTTSPGYKLDVSGTGRFTQPVIVGTPVASNQAATKSYVDSAAGGGVGAGTSGQTLRHNGTAWIANSLLYNNGTNIGIGTTSPGYKLDVNGTANFSNNVRIVPQTASWAEGLYFSMPNTSTWGGLRWRRERGNNDGNWYIGYTALDSTDDLVFGANNGGSQIDNILRLTKAGNVGIGTTSPGAKLHLNVGNITGMIIDGTSQNALVLRRTNGARFIFDNTTGGGGQQWWIATDAIAGGVAGNFGIRDNTAGKDVITLEASTGNVGINDTTPSYKLDVNGTAQFTQPVIVGTPTSGSHAATKSYVDSAAGGGVGAGTSGQTLRHNGTAWIANSLLYNNGTNIGIGTTSPSELLHIENTGTGDADAYLRVESSDTGEEGIKFYIDGTEEARIESGNFYGGDLAFLTGSPLSEQMRIDNNGNVGIGTTSPGVPLEIQSDQSNGIRLRYIAGVYYWDIFRNSDGSLRFNDGNNGNAVTIQSAGNVGINDTTPSYKLDVNGTAQFTQPVIVGTPTSGSHATTKSYVDSIVAGGSGSTVGYWTASGNNIYNSNSGNVGIGTTSPGYKLDVNGTSHFNNSVYYGTQGFISWGSGLTVGNSFIVRGQSGQGISIGSNGTSDYLSINTSGLISTIRKDSSFSNALEGNILTKSIYAISQWREVAQGATVTINGGTLQNGGPTARNGKGKWVAGVGNSITLYMPGSWWTRAISFTGGFSMAYDSGQSYYNYNLPDSFTVEKSTDGITWVNVATVTGNTSWYFFSTNLSDAPYIKITINALRSGQTTSAIQNIQVWDASYTGSGQPFSLSGQGNAVFIGGNVGIGTTSPGYKLDVSGTAQFTQPVIVGTPTASNHAVTKSYMDSSLGSYLLLTGGTMSGAINMSNNNISGVNKLTVATIDPVYQIGSSKYSTYVADTIGIKTTLDGKLTLSKISFNKKQKLYSSTINFNKVEKSSDLWLFWQTISEGENMKDISMTLTPEFNGRTWYEINSAENEIIIYATITDQNMSSDIINPVVSYHLSAPRHDTNNWSNLTKNQNETPSFILSPK